MWWLWCGGYGGIWSNAPVTPIMLLGFAEVKTLVRIQAKIIILVFLIFDFDSPIFFFTWNSPHSLSNSNSHPSHTKKRRKNKRAKSINPAIHATTAELKGKLLMNAIVTQSSTITKVIQDLALLQLGGPRALDTSLHGCPVHGWTAYTAK